MNFKKLKSRINKFLNAKDIFATDNYNTKDEDGFSIRMVCKNMNFACHIENDLFVYHIEICLPTGHAYLREIEYLLEDQKSEKLKEKLDLFFRNEYKWTIPLKD